MKQYKRYLLLLILPLAMFVGCEPEPINPSGAYSFFMDAPQVFSTGATIETSYVVGTENDPTVKAGIMFTEKGGSGFTEVEGALSGNKHFITMLTGLEPNTSYVILAFAETSDGKKYVSTSSRNFTTTSGVGEEFSYTVAVTETSAISNTKATLKGSYSVVAPPGPIVAVGFKYRKSDAGDWTSVTASGTASAFSYQLTDLTPETAYSATAWIKIGETVYESKQAPSEFTTKKTGEDPDPDPSVLGKWAELPVMDKIDDVVYATYYVTSNGQSSASPTTAGRVRNYTVCFDGSKRQPLWVAYPMHSWYSGSAGRKEAWQYGPYISQNIQPNLSSSYAGNYSRGHNVASSDRQKSVAMNKQTFYYTNMSPQIQNEFNGGIWNDLEKKLQGWGFNHADTMYVVTGSAFIGTLKMTADKSGNKLPVPTHFYKVILSSKSGKSGKPISQLAASELKCVGFWFGHFDYGTKDKVSAAQMKSLSYIEEQTGFSFFPSLSNEAESVKDSYKASDWGM